MKMPKKGKRASPVACGSHVPVMIEVAKHFNIKSIIEIGSGTFSTSTFLNREYYPNLDSLCSYETSKGWYEKLTKYIGKDKRWTYKLIGREPSTIEEIGKMKANLLFVDGIKVHRWFALKHFKDKFDIIVMHDANLWKAEKHVPIRKIYRYVWVYKPPERYNETGIFSQKIDANQIEWDIKWDKNFIQSIWDKSMEVIKG